MTDAQRIAAAYGNSSTPNISLQGSMPSIQGGFIGPVLQPAAPAAKVQPAATTRRIQPAASISQVQPAAKVQQVQPAAGGNEVKYSFMDGSGFNSAGQQVQAPPTISPDQYATALHVALNTPAPSYGNSSNGAPPQVTANGYNGGYMQDGNQLLSDTSSIPPMAAEPPVTNPYEAAYAKLLTPSQEENMTQEELNQLIADYKMGSANMEGQGRGIPLALIRGQQEKLYKQEQIKEQTLQEKMALLQAKRTGALAVTKFGLDREDARLKEAKDAAKPIEVGNSLVKLNPKTGKYETVFSPPPEANATSDIKEYNYAKTQGYGGTFLQYMQEKAMLNPASYDVTTDAFGNTKVVSKLAGAGAGGFNTGATGMRTDRHNNPAAFTTDVARQAGLKEGVDYTVGDAFPNNPNLHTARLIGDPIAQTIKVIDKIGFYTQSGQPRWSYVNQLSNAGNWANLDYNGKAAVIAQMYQHEGGNGSLVGGGDASNPAAIAYQQVKANPQAWTGLSSQQQAAVSNYALANNLPLPTQPANDTQNQSAAYATRIQQSGSVLDSLANPIATYNPIGFEAQIRLPSYLQSSQIQQYQQAAKNFINAVLRRESGAAIAQSEFDNAYSQYLPKPGDSAQTLAQKKQNRDAVYQGLVRSSGSAYNGGSTNSGSGNPADPLGLFS